MTAGLSPRCIVSRSASMPASSDGSATASNRRWAGNGTSSTVTRVITPSVPSEPTNSCVSSGPTACRGTGIVSITSPVGVTTRSATTRSSILP